jgi:Transketolase, C-terminal domain/Transketolase, pyrimidine binding domain
MSVGYNHANVKIVGTHAGVGVGEDGYSQMGLEDVALMRSLPNMVVIQPADATEAERATEFLADYEGPAYLRLTRQPVADLFDSRYRFDFGRGVVLRDGSDVTLVASGGVVAHAVVAAEALARDGIDAGVIDVHTLKPIDSILLRAAAAKTGRIVSRITVSSADWEARSWRRLRIVAMSPSTSTPCARTESRERTKISRRAIGSMARASPRLPARRAGREPAPRPRSEIAPPSGRSRRRSRALEELRFVEPAALAPVLAFVRALRRVFLAARPVLLP